jgi:hypothetical protein
MPTNPPNFIIAVFSQPIATFAKWKARGINTLVSHEPEGGRVKKSDWEAAATAAGLFFLDYPSDDDATIAAEAKQTHRLAFMQDDEPDLSRQLSPERTPDGWTRPELLAARYARCKVAAPNVPVFCNFAGPTVTSDAYKGEKHLAYLAAADWLGHDWYVKNKNAQRYPIDHIGKAMDRLAAWSSTGPTNIPPVMTPATAGKPQLVFIECSDQKISPLGRAPTPDEMDAEVQLAVTRGARGVVYFPQRPPPGFQFDATTPELADRMAQINSRLSAANAPAQNEPTLEAVVTQMQALTTRLDAHARELESLKNRKYRVAADLQVIDP